jgi:membrane protease YdiL (CAAX protease family)
MAVPAPVDRGVATPLRPHWGLGDAVIGWLIAYSATAIFTSIIFSVLGYKAGDSPPLSVQALGYPPLWLGFVGIPIWAAATKGNGWIHDFRVRIRPVDVGVGVGAGLVAQFVLVPLVSWPVLWLTHTNGRDLSRPARELANKAGSTPGIILFSVIVVLGAPLAEELFFRGLVLRSFEHRFGAVWAVVLTGVVFGATHFEPLQFAALAAAGMVFGLLAVKADRLGPAVVAHMTFNAATVVNLLVLR